MWIPRAILLAYLVYADIRFLRDPMSSTLFSGITLAFHEMRAFYMTMAIGAFAAFVLFPFRSKKSA